MRSFASIITVLIFSVTLGHAQLTLTGVLQQGTAPSGQTAGSPIWNTLGHETSFANIYLTQPNGGYLAPLINSGNASAASVSFTMTPGTYQFFFFTMGFWDNNPGHYGLNLFFNGDNTNPGISAHSPAGTASADSVAFGLPTLSLSGDNSQPVGAPGSLTYIADGLVITLTSYGFGEPGVFGGAALDRIGNLDSQPDGYFDSVGTFSLVVTAVPEPASLTLCALVSTALLIRRRR